LLGEAGSVVVVGLRRMLVLLHVVNQTGDLALVELDTGATTVLGHSVGAVAVEGSSGSDALAPGTRVAFSLINPIASPYDGVWIVTLP
jgi:malonyl CoA-acyl carrier protein transacylase